MRGIDQQQVKETFAREGFAFPLDAMTVAQATNYRRKLEAVDGALESTRAARNGQLNQLHAVLGFVGEIARNAQILSAVEAIIGPNILLWGTTFFIKKPRTKDYVSWHQDLRYWGLADSDALVSAWLALGPVDRTNGAMQFVPGSHRYGLLEHEDTSSVHNLLYRGQIAKFDIDHANTVDVVLDAGQFSLHHGHLLHASPANPSNTTRYGLTINYVAPRNRQLVASRDYAMLVRGEGRHGHFRPVPEPEIDLSPAALAWHRRLLAAVDGPPSPARKARGGNSLVRRRLPAAASLRDNLQRRGARAAEWA